MRVAEDCELCNWLLTEYGIDIKFSAALSAMTVELDVPTNGVEEDGELRNCWLNEEGIDVKF